VNRQFGVEKLTRVVLVDPYAEQQRSRDAAHAK